MSDPEVKQVKGVLGQLFRRPMKNCENLADQTITVIPSPQELLYFRNCVNCKFVIAGPCAKVTIERCHHSEMEFKERILSGTMEMMFSNGITVSIPPGHKLPTISIDNSTKCHLYLHDKSAIGMIHSVWVEDIIVHLDPPHAPEYRLEHPPGEEGEFITKYGFGKLFTSKGIREGSGYLCTVKEKEIADRKQAEFDKKMTDYVTKMVDEYMKPGRSAKGTTESKEKTPPPSSPSKKNEEQEPEAVQGETSNLEQTEEKTKVKAKQLIEAVTFDPEVKQAKGVLGQLFRRPMKNCENLADQTITVIPSPHELLYFRNCVNCKFVIAGPCAKVTIERCHHSKMEFKERILSGIMEIMFSNRITVCIPPGHKLPTISIDNSTKCHLYLHDKSAIGMIHSVWVEDIIVHLDPPHAPEYRLEHPPGEEGEFITKYGFGKLFTSKGIREGSGYLCTVKEKEIADRKQAEFDKKMTEYVTKMVDEYMKPGGGAKGTTESKEKTPPPSSPPNKNEKQEPEAVSGETSNTIRSNDLKSAKGKLKPTETVVRAHPVVGASRGGRGPGYNIKEDAEKKEFFDNEELLTKKVKRVAEWVKGSKHVIFFTGAGISTSAGIPDFRSGMNTVLPTGPGVWELQEKGVPRNNPNILPILKALPTSTHMSIVKLHETGHCKFTVSQNVDGIHRRSGLPPSQLAELHGNTNLETCCKCKRQYLRDFETREAIHVFDHTTSRTCDDPSCNGQLQDSIVNFGESLPKADLKAAFDHAQKADLCVVLGSSLRVRPACQVPEVVIGNGGKVVICNLQNIPHFPDNSYRSLQVHAMCDVFMNKLMHELELPVPNFLLKRRVKVTSEKDNDILKVTVAGVDVDEDMPYSFIQTAKTGDTKATLDPFTFSLPSTDSPIEFTLTFHGHYREPPLTLAYIPSNGTCFYKLAYDVMGGQWHQLLVK